MGASFIDVDATLSRSVAAGNMTVPASSNFTVCTVHTNMNFISEYDTFEN